MLSINFMCSNFIIKIFSPLITSSGLHFKNTALFNMKCRSKALPLWAITITSLTQGCESQEISYISYRFVPERVFPPTTLLAILFDIVRLLASRKELLYAYQIRNMHFSCIGVPGNLRRFKIVE